MICSAGCDYAIRALIRLAQQAPEGGFCLLRRMIDPDRLPQHFVGKMLQELVRADILLSAKGRNGGFALRIPPDELTLRQIVEAIDGADPVSRCFSTGGDDGHFDCWLPAQKAANEVLDKTTLADLVATANKRQRGRR